MQRLAVELAVEITSAIVASVFYEWLANEVEESIT